jgi:hypothetical protein
LPQRGHGQPLLAGASLVALGVGEAPGLLGHRPAGLDGTNCVLVWSTVNQTRPAGPSQMTVPE